MRIDVHTHIWPDRIAEAVLQTTMKDMEFNAIAPNTVEGIKGHLRESGGG